MDVVVEVVGLEDGDPALLTAEFEEWSEVRVEPGEDQHIALTDEWQQQAMREVDVDHADAGQCGEGLAGAVKAVDAVAVVEELADLHDQQVVLEGFIRGRWHGGVPGQSGSAE